MSAALHRSTSTARQFKIGAVGVSTQEFNSITFAFGNHPDEDNHYAITAVSEENMDAAHNLDFFILGNCDSKSLLAWQHFARTQGLNKPVIRIVRKTAPNPFGYFLQLPLENSTIKAVLDTYVETELPAEEIVSLDATLVASEAAKHTASQKQNKRLHKRILAVDDTLSVRVQINSLFRGSNVHTDVYDCPEQALHAAEKHCYDVIFINTTLSHLNGFSLCKQIKQSFFNRVTPVVLLSANCSTLDKIRGKLAGSNACLKTPLSANDLANITQPMYGPVI